jgi:tripartite-type tricarboxylate transporter receptor subunit TctC
VPSFKELGYPNTGALMDRIVVAPAGVPQDRIDKLRAAFARLYEGRTFKRLIKQLGENTNKMDGPDYEKVRMAQTEEYAKLVKKLMGQ